MNLVTLQPLHDHLVVQRLPAHDGLIIVPQVAEQPAHIGRVLAVGPGRRNKHGRRQPMDVQPGDVIWFSLNDAEDGDLCLIRQADVGGHIDGC